MNKIKIENKEELQNILTNRYKESVKNKTYIIDVSDLDVSEITSFKNLFKNFYKLKKINGLETWNTSNVIDMGFMFYNCINLIFLNVNNFDTSKVTHMELMFGNCESLETVNIINFDYSKIIDIEAIFCGCKKLTKIIGVEKIQEIPILNPLTIFFGCASLPDDIKNIFEMN